VVQSVASTVSSGADSPSVFTARELLMINILDLDIQVTRQVQAIHLRDYYKKYCVLTSTLPKIATAPWQHPDSGWDGKPPTEKEVIELFIGKSAWHNSWMPKFNRVVQHFPEMKKWLEDDPTAELTKKLWGRDQDQLFKLNQLQFWMDNNGTLDVGGSKKSKGKSKAQDSAVGTGVASGSGEGKKKKKKSVVSSTK